MAGGGSGGGSGGGGGTFDPTAWHKGGDNIGVAKKLGSLDDFDVLFVRNDFQVCQLEFEVESGKDYHYLGFDRGGDGLNEGQYVTCIQEQDQGSKAYVAMEFTNLDNLGNVVGDCDIGIAGHGYSAAIAGLEADDYFITSNHGMLLKGVPIKFLLWTGAITASEVCRISDGGGAYPAGILEFDKDATGRLEDCIYFHNTRSDDSVRVRFKADVADTYVGVTGSAFTPASNLLPNDFFIRNVAGGAVVTASGTNKVRVAVNDVDLLQCYDNGSDSRIVEMVGMTGKYSILQLNVAGGGNNALWIHMLNSAGKRGFITLPEDSGGNNNYAQKDGYVTIAGAAGLGVRCNVNAANDSGWTIDTGGDMLIFSPKFGTHTGIGAETVTGYITIKDVSGTPRKLAVVS